MRPSRRDLATRPCSSGALRGMGVSSCGLSTGLPIFCFLAVNSVAALSLLPPSPISHCLSCMGVDLSFSVREFVVAQLSLGVHAWTGSPFSEGLRPYCGCGPGGSASPSAKGRQLLSAATCGHWSCPFQVEEPGSAPQPPVGPRPYLRGEPGPFYSLLGQASFGSVTLACPLRGLCFISTPQKILLCFGAL